MPYVRISLAKGKPTEYLDAVSDAIHAALVDNFGMNPQDLFQRFEQYEPGEFRFSRTFRASAPRSDDFVMFEITDGPERGEIRKKAFYKTLTARLAKAPGIAPQDVLVMITVTPPINFSFGDGVSGPETIARETLDRAASAPGATGRRASFTNEELAGSIASLFSSHDVSRFSRLLSDDFTLTMPAPLPFAGSYTGADGFDALFRDMGEKYYVELDRVMDAGDHLIARTTVTARDRVTEAPVVLENVWIFDIAGGNLAACQAYTDSCVVEAVG